MAEKLDRLLYLGTVNRALLNLGDVLIGFLQGLLYIPDAFKNVFLFRCLLVTDRKIKQIHTKKGLYRPIIICNSNDICH